MLEGVLGNYLNGLSEREFDAPLLALLWARGYRDVHFLHGSAEFGKDFVAKGLHGGAQAQLVIQSKSGDVRQGDWRQIAGQLEEALSTDLAHPGFDPALQRVVVLVLTGRLVGNAKLLAQEWARKVAALNRGFLEVWDRERLIEWMRADLLSAIGSSAAPRLMHSLAAVSATDFRAEGIEELSRDWMDEAVPATQAVMEASIVCRRLDELHRRDLACLMALGSIRGLSARVYRDNAVDDPMVRAAEEMFRHYSSRLWETTVGLVPRRERLAGLGSEFATFVTYPARCLRLLELLSLLSLYDEGRLGSSDPEIVRFIVDCVENEPGAAHPLSDNWAASLISIGVVVGRADPDLLDTWLCRVGGWICDCYQGRAGLARQGSPPATEVDYLLGDPLEHVNVPSRRTSLLASACLDLAAVFERQVVYEKLINDFLACDVSPEVVEVPDNFDQFIKDGSTVTHDPSSAYLTDWTPTDGWKVAGHHMRGASTYRLSGEHAWRHLAVTAVLRDRWFLPSMREIARAH